MSEDAEMRLAAMNAAFARHDAAFRAGKCDHDVARAQDLIGQSLKSRLLADGWRMKCDKRGRFSLVESVGPMILAGGNDD